MITCSYILDNSC